MSTFSTDSLRQSPPAEPSTVSSPRLDSHTFPFIRLSPTSTLAFSLPSTASKSRS